MVYSKYTVMIVDDYDGYRMLMQKIVESYFQAKVVVAKNPVEAFEVMDKVEPDLIILDMQMPYMDGFTALQNIRHSEKTKNTPVVAFSALGNDQLLSELIKWKISDYIKKPTTTKVVVEKIGNVLKRILENEVMNQENN